MKQTTKMSRAVGQLEHIYNALNTDFFDGALPMPIITVQSKPGTYGHCSVAKVWRRAEEHTYELNIAAEVLNYPIEETLDTMLHEMVHLYCRENGIKEVSRGGRYHNGKFKEEAEKRGLTCYQCGSAGWNTRPGDNLVEYALNKGWNEIRIAMFQHTSQETEQAEGYQGKHTDTGKPLKVQASQAGDNLFIGRNGLAVIVSSNRLGPGGIGTEQGTNRLRQGGGLRVASGMEIRNVRGIRGHGGNGEGIVLLHVDGHISAGDSNGIITPDGEIGTTNLRAVRSIIRGAGIRGTVSRGGRAYVRGRRE